MTPGDDGGGQQDGECASNPLDLVRSMTTPPRNRGRQPRRETAHQRLHRLARQREYNNRRRRVATTTELENASEGALVSSGGSMVSMGNGAAESVANMRETEFGGSPRESTALVQGVEGTVLQDRPSPLSMVLGGRRSRLADTLPARKSSMSVTGTIHQAKAAASSSDCVPMTERTDRLEAGLCRLPSDSTALVQGAEGAVQQDRPSPFSMVLGGRRSRLADTPPARESSVSVMTTTSSADRGRLPVHHLERSKDRTVIVARQSTGSMTSGLHSETSLQRERRLDRQHEYNQQRRRALTSTPTNDSATTVRESEEQYQRRLSVQRTYNARRRRSSVKTSSGDLAWEVDSQHHSEFELQGTQDQNCNRHQVRSEGTVDKTVDLDRIRESEERHEQRLAQQRLYRKRRLNQVQAVRQETPEQRESRLAKKREDNRRRRQGSASIASTVLLAPVNAGLVCKTEASLRDALGAEGLDECVCAVCDRLVLRNQTQVINADSPLLSAIQTRLLAPTDLPPVLVAHYACNDIHESLDKLLLSRKGLRASPDGVDITVCKECFESISKESSEPPKFSIANGFYIGQLPDHLAQATWVETIMTQLVTVIAQTRVMRGGRHRAIRSHCMVFDATPGPPATLLPRRVDRGGPYSIVLAGPLTPTQTDTIRKLHRVRGGTVQELLEFYVSHNHFYSNVGVSSDQLRAVDDSLCDRVSVIHEDEEASVGMDDEQSSLVDDATGTAGESEDAIIERNILLVPQDVVPDASFVQQVVDMNAHEPTTVPRLRVNHSSRHASTVNVEAKMYPHLFPFGRGHPDEIRSVHVSKRDCIRYYSMLSSRRFAQDPTFIMTAFARLALENMFMLTSVKCKRYGSLFEGYEALSQSDLAAALINNERRQRGERQRDDVSATAARFLKSVELASVSVWGSSAERRQCRQEAFGYQTRYGQPSLFVTLTPNTDNSYAMAHYTGILSVDTLFDALEARIPSASSMKKAALADDCASARLFMRTVDSFIAEVLGIDPKTQSSKDEGGLFGKTKAYFGMVETQGRGTLHIHFLIWLFGAPINSDDFEEQVKQHGEDYERDLEEFASSIVTNELPLSIDDVRCSKCNVTGGYLPLPIPKKARQQQHRHKETRMEPLLVECGSCGQHFSAQHAVRQLLLQHRPPHWPPPLEPIDEKETKHRVAKEARARSSVLEASRIVREREIIQASLESSEADVIARWILEMDDATQLPYRRARDDAVQFDTMSRLIEMLPPSRDVARMSPTHRAYMLTSLVAKFNMHSWSHTASCFKQSRATSSSSSCRYGFPRKRALDVSLSGASVTMPRSLGHEYINGYNPVIMEAFKCNHDIQILFGGKDAVNRIYYCCKYVTKTQRQIDSSTAVALASFQRRQAREETEALSDMQPTVMDVRRRRVTSMAYTFTNKQEIAGPLAALYLLRGSCCYSSANCVKLPLPDILRQLEGTGDYSCTMVQSSSNQDSVYTSTSHLDDYIYRPEATSSSSLYEYTMRCYRRPIGGTTSASSCFSDLHPLSGSHCVAFRRTEFVPVISGPRLPRLKPEMLDDERERYAKMALVLFKPFRSMWDLVGSNASEAHPWHAAYCEWESSSSTFVRSILANMQDFHAGRDAESEAYADDDGEKSEASSSECDSSDDGYVTDDIDDEVDDNNDDFDILALFGDSLESAGDNQPLQIFPAPSKFPPRIEGVLSEFETNHLVAAHARYVAGVHTRGSSETTITDMGVAELKKWVDSSSTDVAQDVAINQDAAAREVIERDTSVDEIIDHALQLDQLQWQSVPPHVTARPPTPMYCGIAEMSRIFTLNELQHGGFAMVATYLLRRWRSGSADAQENNGVMSDEELRNRQLLMFLGGEGGTGKSRVIHAIQELCRSWGRPDALVVTALTGKAASLIDGRTLASFEIALRGSNGHAAVQGMDCLIIDEVSMMSKDQLLRLDRLLRKAKRIDSVPFGGIHMILVGDFLQLPPVGADPLFVDPIKKVKPSLTDLEGFELWRRFNKIIVLRDSVRFREDPAWGEGCSKARYGIWTPEFIDMINQRVVDYAPQDESTYDADKPVETVFVTPDNETRSAINGHFIARTASLLVENQHPIRVVANFKGSLNNLSVEDIKYVMGLPDTKFDRMAPYLDLVRGMPIQITQNIRTAKGVANGTMGHLESVRFSEGTSFRRALDKRTGTTVLLPDKPPLFALVRLQRGSGASPITEGTDSDLFPVFPDAEGYKKASIPLTSSPGDTRTLSVKIQQFPFVCAVGATVYKVQGESLKSMAVVDWKVSLKGANKPQQAYLMVSRVVKRTGLICLKPLTPEIAAWAKPPAAAIDEDRRLNGESDRTLRDFYASLRESA